MTDSTERNILKKILVDEETAKRLEQLEEKGKELIEITFRTKEGYIESIPKALLEKGIDDNSSNDILETLAKKVDGLASKEQVGNAVKAIKDAEGKIDGLSSNIKNLSTQFGRVFQDAKVLKTISFVNTGLNVANLVVNVAGFIIIAKKLNDLDAKITKDLESLSAKVDKLIANTTNEHYSKWHKLILDYNNVADYIDETSLKEIGELLSETRSFFTLLLADYHQNIVDGDICLEMLTGLLPVYTSLLDLYIVKHYTAKQSLPNNYEQFMSVYEDVLASSVLAKMTDLLFIDKQLNWNVTQHAVDSYVCSVINYATRIQDRTKLIQFFETEAKLKAYDERVKQHVEEEAMSYADEIAEDLGISSSECKRVMQLAIN